MADVSDFLSMNPEDIPESITLPEGSYDFVITSYRTDKVGENQNEIVRLNCKANAVLESDITDADLENCDGTRLELVKSGLGLSFLEKDEAILAENNKTVQVKPTLDFFTTVHFVIAKDRVNEPVIKALMQEVSILWNLEL